MSTLTTTPATVINQRAIEITAGGSLICNNLQRSQEGVTNRITIALGKMLLELQMLYLTTHCNSNKPEGN
jgi:hypothetical protein